MTVYTTGNLITQRSEYKFKVIMF